MRRLAYLTLCVLMANPLLADEAPTAKPTVSQDPFGGAVNPFDANPKARPYQDDDPFGQPKTPKPAAPTIQDDDPFGAASNPFGGPSNAKKPAARGSQDDDPFGGPSQDPFGSPNKAKKPAARGSQDDDPFGGPSKDPFGSPNKAKKPATGVGAKDPFGANPASPASKKTSNTPKRASGLRSAPTFPSITLEEPSQARKHIEAALAGEAAFDYLDTPLKDVIDAIAIQHDIPMMISVKALEDYGIGTDTPVTIGIKGVSLRSAMRLMLDELELTFVIRNETLQITTLEDADSNLRSRFYAVSNLLPSDRGGDYLVKLITKHIAPDSWDEVGGPGAITFVDHLETLAVTQTEDVLHEIDGLLAAVARLAEQR